VVPRETDPIGGCLFDIQRWSTEDGPGIRTTIFFKGCPLRCAWCCNPESWSPKPQLGFFEERCKGCGACISACSRGLARPATGRLDGCEDCGFCATACPHGARQLLGRWWSAEEILAEVGRDAIFHRRSGGGVTFSGGEATAQPRLLEHLAMEFHRRGVHQVLETCGHFPWEWNAKALSLMDLVYFDLKHMDEAAHERWIGVGTDLIQANALRIAEMGIPMIVRFPLIPGVNDERKNLVRMAVFVKERLKAPLEVMPFHPLGRHKHRAVGSDSDFAEPAPNDVEMVRELLRAQGVTVLESGPT
jgi:pyruvate formate lyase activating enzyme